MRSKQVFFSLICFVVNSLIYIASSAVLTLVVMLIASRTISGLESDALSTLAVAVGSMFFAMLLATLSLLPSYFICMKLARYLREKRGWPIDRPRRLFAYSLLTPIGLLIFLIFVGSIMS